MVGRYDGAMGESLGLVRAEGIYVAKWTSSDDDQLQTIRDSERPASSGDQLGFRRNSDGRVVGVHNKTVFELADVPTDAKYLVWYHQETHTTQFSKEVGKAGTGTMEVVSYTVIGTVAVVIIIVCLYGSLESGRAK